MRFTGNFAITLALTLLGFGPGWAATTVSVGSGPALPGGQIRIPVNVSTDVNLVGFQMDVGFDASKLVLVAVHKGAVLGSDHVVLSNEIASGSQRLLIYSEQNHALASGELLQLDFDIAQGAALGPVAVTLSGLLIADPSAASVTPDSVGSGAVSVLEVLPAAVAGRFLFYNNSSFDQSGNSNAVATDKQALLPGGQASFANYSSYHKGINGVIVDIDNLADAGAIDAADFGFRVGNSAQRGDWTAGPAPTAISVEVGGGSNGSDRIFLEWADQAIQKQWLEVTVLANADTGLTANDVFYFGNSVADSGNSAANAQVDVSDESGARNHPRNFLNPAPIDFAYDYNRDGKVDVSDENLARINGSNFLTALKMLDLRQQQGASISRVAANRRAMGESGLMSSVLKEGEPPPFARVETRIELQISRAESGVLLIEASGGHSGAARLQFKRGVDGGDWSDAAEAERGRQPGRWLVPAREGVAFYRLLSDPIEGRSVDQ